MDTSMAELVMASMWVFWLIIILGIWEGVWKLIALWKCGRRNQMGWFIAIGLLNTVGILPIIYLLVHRGKESKTTPVA